MGSSGGLRLGENSVGLGLIGKREVGLRRMGLIGVGWVLGGRTGWRCGSEAWILDLGLGLAWVGDVEAGGGVGRRRWDREMKVTEREKGTVWAMRWEWLRERTSFIILIGPGIKIIFFLALMNSARLSIDVHCSNGVKKNRFSSNVGACFLWLRS